jgi:single-strand DNA-binding protein
MPSLNKVFLMGHLGSDPEIRYTQSGAAVANFSVATSERWKDKVTGEDKENTEWHRIVAWNKTAEIAGERLRKGDLVFIDGRIQTRGWEDKNGNKRYTTEIVAHFMQYFNKRQEAPIENQKPAEKHEEDDIPF